MASKSNALAEKQTKYHRLLIAYKRLQAIIKTSHKTMFNRKMRARLLMLKYKSNLVSYNPRMRSLQAENNRLLWEFRTSQKTIITMHNHQISSERKLLAKINHLKVALKQKNLDFKHAQHAARVYETFKDNLQLEYNRALSDLETTKDLEKERDFLRKLLNYACNELLNKTRLNLNLDGVNQDLRNEITNLKNRQLRCNQFGNTLVNQIFQLQTANAALSNRNRDLQKLFEVERQRNARLVAQLEAEVMRLRGDIATQVEGILDLKVDKVVLDLEIATYRRMLDSGEAPSDRIPEDSARPKIETVPFFE